MVKTKKSLSLVLTLLIVFNCVFSACTALASGFKTVEGNYNYSYASEVLSLVNAERSRNGLSPLVMTEELTEGAMLRAAECAVSFSHTRPNGTQCFTAFKWSKSAGENIAYGQRSPEQVMNGWMNSSGHRANILGAGFKTVGIGCFEYNGTLYWAQAFSGGTGSGYSPSGKRAVRVEVSLSTGEESRVNFTESKPETTTAPAPQTTAPSTTKAPETTTSPTTKAPETTTKKGTAAQPSKQNIKRKIYSKIRYYFRVFSK